jgi:drug/metabolite transporter (DMT)-like permease
MNAALLGLVAALSWGLHDFLARFPSRAVGPVPTVLAVTFAGLIVLSAWLAFDGGTIEILWPSLWLVAVTGIVFAGATLALFAALTLGPISIVAPLAGSYPALAMIFAVAQGFEPSLTQWLGVGAVMAGVGLVSRSGGHYEASGHLPSGKLRPCLASRFWPACALPSRSPPGKRPRPSSAMSKPYGSHAVSASAPSALSVWRAPARRRSQGAGCPCSR